VGGGQIRMSKSSVLCALLFIGSLSLLESACSRAKARAKDKADGPVAVKAVEIREHPITRMVEAVGTLFPDDQVVVSSQVEAPVQKFLVDVGDSVQTGQVMAVLDQEELRYTADRRASDLQRTLARLGLSDENGTVKDVAELPDVKKAAASRLDAEQRYKRARDMFQQDLLPRQDLDTAEARYASAKADYDVTVQQVKQLQAQARSEKADLDLARKKVRDTEIRAPFAGFVQERHIAPGQYLRLQAPVMTLVKPDPLRLRADVPEAMAHWIADGDRVEAISESLAGQKFQGRISRIAPAVKDQSRSFSIEALIDNHTRALKPGAFVRVTVVTHKIDKVLLAPENALLYSFGVYKVLVVEEGKLATREVKIGDQREHQVEIAAGLKPGEWVALNPEKLRAGETVVVNQTEADK
jgi:multidrug efflux pump subunit AcrA (membrane-fusion protein)